MHWKSVVLKFQYSLEIYYNYNISWFSSVHPCDCRDSTLKYATTNSFHIFSNSLISSYRIIENCSLSYGQRGIN
jgi:hypothetical protein